MRADTLVVDVLEIRLREWAAWLTAGGNCAGYPTKSVLHQSWMPPSPGMLQTARARTVSDARERAMDAAVRGLSVRLQDTVAVVYLMRARPDEQAQRLGCQITTVRARVREAKRAIGMALAAAVV